MKSTRVVHLRSESGVLFILQPVTPARHSACATEPGAAGPPGATSGRQRAGIGSKGDADVDDADGGNEAEAHVVGAGAEESLETDAETDVEVLAFAEEPAAVHIEA